MYFSTTPQAWPMPGRHVLACDAMMSIAWNVTICHLRVREDKMSPLSSSLMEQLYGREKKVSIFPQQSRDIYQCDLLALSCSLLHSLTVFISRSLYKPLLPILATIGVALEVASDTTLQQWQASKKKKSNLFQHEPGLWAVCSDDIWGMSIDRKKTNFLSSG